MPYFSTLRSGAAILGSTAVILCAFALPILAGAEEGFVPLAETEIAGSKFGQFYQASGAPNADLSHFLTRVFFFAITIGAILAVLRIAYAGFLYITTDLLGTKERAREILRDTVLGLMLLLAVYIILWQINPDILTLSIAVPATTVSPTAVPQTTTGGINANANTQGAGNTGLIITAVPRRYPGPQANMICGTDAHEAGDAGTGLSEWECGHASASACSSVGLRECRRY